MVIGFLEPMHTILLLKWHLDWFNHFARLTTAQHTDREGQIDRRYGMFSKIGCIYEMHS